jgi:hypothetical protein
VPLDDEARTRVDEEISSALKPLIICGLLLAAFAVGLYFTWGLLVIVIPLDFAGVGLLLGFRIAVLTIVRGRADRRGGMMRGEAEVRWRKFGYQWVLEDGRTFQGDAGMPFGRYRLVVLPRLGLVLRHELIDDASPAEARAAQDEAMDTVLRVTPASLQANEAGRLTGRQRRQVFWGVLGFILVVFFLLLIGLFRPWSLLILVPLAVGIGWLAGDAVRAWWLGRAVAIEGEVTSERIGGKYPSYHLTIDGRRLSTDIMVYNAFRLVGERHRIITSSDGQVMVVRALP